MNISPSIMFIFLCISLLVQAEDDMIIRPHLQQLHRGGRLQRDIASDLRVSPSLVSKYLGGHVQTSPTITRQFRRSAPDTFLGLCQKKARATELAALPHHLTLHPSHIKGQAPQMFLFLQKRVGAGMLCRHVKKETADELSMLPDGLLLKPSAVKTYAGGHAVENVKPEPIAIGHRIEGDGKAAFYDHQTLRSATRSATVSVCGVHHNMDHLETYARGLPFQMQGSQGKMPKALAVVSSIDALLPALKNTGLLVIAGRASKHEGHEVQNKFEAALIRQAMIRGQPVLGICAGCWPLWQYTPRQGEHERPMPRGRLTSVTDHVAGKMVYMSEAHGRPVHNAQIHGVEIEAGTLLRDILNTRFLRVNSVHSTAPAVGAYGSTPLFFQVSAWSVQDDKLETKNRHGDLMNPEEDTVEAFETKYGAPVLGIQWHPEAYQTKNNTKGVTDPDKHMDVIKYMQKAGEAYGHKRNMLAEMEQIFQHIPAHPRTS